MVENRLYGDNGYLALPVKTMFIDDYYTIREYPKSFEIINKKRIPFKDGWYRLENVDDKLLYLLQRDGYLPETQDEKTIKSKEELEDFHLVLMHYSLELRKNNYNVDECKEY